MKDDGQIAIFLIFFYSIASSLLIVAMVKIEISLPAKILIFFLLICLILIIKLLIRLTDQQANNLNFLKGVYISLEQKRLHPENITPAHEILISEIKEQKDFKDIEKNLTGLWHPAFEIIAVAVFIIPTILCTMLLLGYWDKITAFLSSLLAQP